MNDNEPARTAIVDPPWPGQGAPYSTLSLGRIRDLPVGDLMAPDAQLLLWAPGSLIGVAIAIGEHWGFRYRQAIIWYKGRPGRPTRYLMACTEYLLYFTRGDAIPKVRGQQTFIVAPVTAHSEKPGEAHVIAERIGEAPYLELFARQRPSSTADWHVWGDELEADLVVPGYPVPSDFTRGTAR